MSTINKTEETTNKDGVTTTTKKESTINTNPDGKTTITNSTVSKSVKNEIKLDNDTKVSVSELDAGQDDVKYIEVLRKKGQLAILKGTNQYISMLSLKHFELILKKMGTNLQEEINLVAFGIYSIEEINEIKKSIEFDVPKVVFQNVTKYLEVKEPEINKINKNEKNFDNTIFVNIQEKLDFIKAEEERKRKEEEERKRKLEEENKIKMELKEKRREKAKAKLKKIREDNIREILMKKFIQYRNNIQGLKIIETKKKTETEKKVLRLKIKKDPKIKADEEAKKKEEERKRKEEEERKRKEEEERKRLEEEERKRKEEEERKRLEEEERKRLEEEARLKKEEEEKKRLEEEAKKKKEQEEIERKKLEEEEARKKKELEEEEKRRLEEEERLKQEQEENERKKLELEKSNTNPETTTNIETIQYDLKDSKKLRGTNQKLKEENNNYISEEIKLKDDSEPTEESQNQKPKKKKVIKKVKKIVKIPKKKLESTIDNRKPFYISGSTSISGGGGIGHYHENVTYTGCIPKAHFNSYLQCECTNCHNKYNNNKFDKITNINGNNLFICENCEKNLKKYGNNSGNKNISNLKSYEYYKNLDEDKYEGINEKEFFEMNRNRYLNKIWQKENEGIPRGKKGIKSKSIEKTKNINFDEDSEFDRYINGFTSERYGIKDDNNNNSDINGNNENKNNLNRKIKRCRNNSSEILSRHNNENYNNNIDIINGMNINDINEDENNNNINNRKINLRVRNQFNQYNNYDIIKNQFINSEEKNIDKNNNKTNNNANNKIIISGNKKDVKEMNCPQCQNSYVLTREIRFYHCTDCKNIMCGKCSKEHYMKYPEHNCTNTDVNGIFTNLSSEFNKVNNNNNEINDNINNDINNNNIKLKENKKRKINIKKYINKNQNLNQDNNINDNNDEYNINNNEILLRNKKDINPINNNNYNYNNKNNEENGGEYNYEDCFMCGIKQRENTQDKFYLCRECDNLLCQNCRIKHDQINPEHNLVISYISGEINNNNDNICIHCQNKLRNNNNIDISEEDINNNNIKLRKEKINQNIQSMQMIQNKQNIDNYTLDNNNNISYQYQKSYPYDNDEYNIKTQYQNDYNDKYHLLKNLMNNRKDKNINENINNNMNTKDYYNPIDEYDKMKDTNNINDYQINTSNNIYQDNELQNNIINTKKIREQASPTKKRILIKRYHNNLYQNQNEDEDNNYERNELNDEYKEEEIKNKNRDLYKRRKCKIEFDLSKNEMEFDRCEIFGNPVCYNCLKSKKDEKNFKIFYCSQCMKLFCKDCLYQHNINDI